MTNKSIKDQAKNKENAKRYLTYPFSISSTFKAIFVIFFIIGSVTFSNVILSEINKSFFYLSNIAVAAAYAHPSDSNEQENVLSSSETSGSLPSTELQIPQHIQNEWTSKRDNTKIIFSSSPSEIVTDKNINLRFDVLNLATGQYVKDFDAKVTMISNNESMFKFQSLSNNKGYFDINHTFFDPGTTKIFLRIDKPSQFFSTAAAFLITTSPNENNLINLLYISILFIVIVLIVILIASRKLKAKNSINILKKFR